MSTLATLTHNILPQADVYRTLVIDYMTGGLQESLSRVQQHEHSVPEGDLRQALLLLDYGLKEEDAWPATRALILALAPKMEQMGYRQEWIPYLERGIAQSRCHDDRTSEGLLLYQLGLLYRLLGQHTSARIALEESYQIFDDLNEAVQQAKALNQLAYVAWQQGQAEETIRNANQALSLLPEDHIECAMAYSALGLMAVEQLHFEKAEEYHRKTLRIRKKYGDTRLIAWSLQNLGVAIQRQKKYAEAIQYYDEALELLEAIKDQGNQGIVYSNIGLTKHKENRFLDAFESYARAEIIFRKIGDNKNLAGLLINQGLTYFAVNDLSEAENRFLRSKQLFTQLGNDAQRLNATDGLIMTKIALHEYADARLLLTEAMADLEKMPELPNYAYLAKSFGERQQTLEAVGTGVG